jgi:ABC-type uncharacterized transport system YnjBCD ATPase subunit
MYSILAVCTRIPKRNVFMTTTAFVKYIQVKHDTIKLVFLNYRIISGEIVVLFGGTGSVKAAVFWLLSLAT